VSVYKPKGSPYYHYDFQRRGRRYCGSTECTDRREAQRIERAERERAKAAEATEATRPPFRERDVTRAAQAAMAAGLTVRRVEITPDGKIVLVTDAHGGEPTHA